MRFSLRLIAALAALPALGSCSAQPDVPPPLSEEAHYVERIWLDGENLRSTMTITDPVTLEKPWVSNIVWGRDTGFDRMIQVDWTNDRTGNDGENNTIEPPQD